MQEQQHIGKALRAIAIVCIFAIIAFYTNKALELLPSSHEEELYTWLNSQIAAMKDDSNTPNLSLNLHVQSKHGSKTWTLQPHTDTQAYRKKINRLLELALISDAFLYDDSNKAKQVSTVTLTNGEKTFTAVLSEERIQNSPALQNLIQLSRLYAEEEQLQSADPA